jgi:bifunctional DNA-binding transcriptional regulator/antitoxin component of YhaV-PrlF toxin-antitoxin module
MAAVKVSGGGRVVIPADLRAKHGIAVGDELFWHEDGEQLVLSTRMAGIRRAQAIVRKYIKPGSPSMVDELIRERREEAARE